MAIPKYVCTVVTIVTQIRKSFIHVTSDFYQFLLSGKVNQMTLTGDLIKKG